MEILSVFVVVHRKIQKSSRTTWNFYTVARIQSLKEGNFQSGWARLALLSFVYMYVFTLSLRMPNKTKKKWISCVCQSSSRFTNNNNYFCIVKLHGSPGHLCTRRASGTQHKSTNWNGGSISIRWLAWKPPKSVKSTSGNFSCLEKIWF